MKKYGKNVKLQTTAQHQISFVMFYIMICEKWLSEFFSVPLEPGFATV